DAGDVLEAGGVPGVGMDVQAVALFDRQGKALEKGDLLGRQPAAGPFDGPARIGMHLGRRRARDREIVVAEHGDSPACHRGPDGLDDRAGIGAVSDVIAEKNELVGPRPAGVREAGRQGLLVGVHVGKNRDQHRERRPPGRLNYHPVPMGRSALPAVLLALSAPLCSAQEPATLDRAPLARAVRAEFVDAWQAYVRYALPHDELKPVSRQGRDWHEGQSLLMTPVDALDTMVLMGLSEEVEQARTLLVQKLSFDRDISVKNF